MLNWSVRWGELANSSWRVVLLAWSNSSFNFPQASVVVGFTDGKLINFGLSYVRKFNNFNTDPHLK